jgi:hypothetical protein
VKFGEFIGVKAPRLKRSEHSVTLLTSQLLISWLKDDDANIYHISVTFEVSQLPMSWLKFVSENMQFIFGK